MNVTEAIHVQTVLDWLTNPHAGDEAEHRARESAVVLANRARLALGAGPDGVQIDRTWPQLLSACPGCSACQPRRAPVPAPLQPRHDADGEVGA